MNNNGTEFIFPDSYLVFKFENINDGEKNPIIDKNSLSYDLEYDFGEVEENLTDNESYNETSHSIIKKSNLTIHLENFLNTLIEKNIKITLPEKVTVKYFNYNKIKQFKSKLFSHDNELVKTIAKKTLKRGYIYPASSSFSSGIINISNNFDFSNTELSDFKQCFDGAEKTLEYVFSHELGHLFLGEKNKTIINENQDELFTTLSSNIQEGFSESFAIQMMCIVYGEDKVSGYTKKFKELKNNSLNNEKDSVEKFLKDKTLGEKFSDLFPIVKSKSSSKMFHSYEFPEIYDNLPLKDSKGNIETDIEKIYKGCLELALKNNKQVIKNKLNNENIKKFGFDKKLIEDLQETTKLKTDLIDKLIDTIHDTFTNKGFLKEKTKALDSMNKIRANHYSQSTNNSSHKPK